MKVLRLFRLKVELFFIKAIPFVIALLIIGIFTLIVKSELTDRDIKENSAYIRVHTCILSVNPPREAEHIQYCYKEAEKTMNIKLDDFSARAKE